MAHAETTRGGGETLSLQCNRQMAGQGTYYVMNNLLNHCTAIM